MKNKFIFFSDILLCVVVAMLCIECILISGEIKNLELQVAELKIQVETLTDEEVKIKSDMQSIASDTDAQIQSIEEQRQEEYEQINKDIKDLQKSTEEEKKEEPEEVSKEVNNTTETYVAETITYEESAAEPEPAPAPEPEPAAEPESSGGMTYCGIWEISAYEETGNCCANGNYPTAWHTCAFNAAPLGATIYIDGLGYFVNEDVCGTPGRLDIYLGDVGSCIQFGIQYYDVYIVD